MMTVAVILAGGQGLRFGGNKPFQPFGTSTLIEQVIDRLKPQVDRLALNAGVDGHPLAQRIADLGLPVLTDRDCSGRGPLSGVLTAMRWAASLGETQVITAPCDMPYLPRNYVERLQSTNAGAAGYFSGARDHPLCAMWPVGCLNALEVALSETMTAQGLPVRRFLERIGASKLSCPDEAHSFRNINSAEHLNEDGIG